MGKVTIFVDRSFLFLGLGVCVVAQIGFYGVATAMVYVGICCCAGKEISEEEGVNSLMPPSTNVGLCFAGRVVRKKKTGQ